MSWRYRIAMVVLFVLAAVPIARTLCAIDCSAAPAPVAAHHDSGQACAQPVPPSSGPQIESGAPDGCGTHGEAMLQVARAASDRGDMASKSGTAAIGAIAAAFAIPLIGPSLFNYSAPPGTAPPTTLPTILRV